jgi:hypothetical protein
VYRIFGFRADSGHTIYFGVCLLLRVKPPFVIGADPSLETQLSFIQTFFSSAARFGRSMNRFYRARSDAPESPIIVDLPETIQFCKFEDIVKFRPRDRPVQFRILIGAIAGAVLVHQVEIGVRRDLFGDEA